MAVASTGKPFLADQSLGFNLSHSGDWIVGRSVPGRDWGRFRRDRPSCIGSAWLAILVRKSRAHYTREPVRLFYDLWAMKEAWLNQWRGCIRRHEKVSTTVNRSESANACRSRGRYLYRIEAGSRHASALATNFRVEAQPCYDMGGVMGRLKTVFVVI